MTKFVQKVFVFTLFFSSFLSFSSWIISRHEISPGESTRLWALQMPSIARAGFPIQALEIPPPPLGSDWIPREMLAGVLLNELFWFVWGIVLALLIVRIKGKEIEKYQASVFVLGWVFVFLHMILFVFWFD